MKDITIRVWGSNTYRRSYFNSVACDGVNLIAPWGAASRSYRGVEVEETSGGYTCGDGNHAWEAAYTLRVRCQEGKVKVDRRQLKGSSGIEILTEKVLA